MLILFLVLWALLFAASILAITAVPTTVRTPNSALVRPLLATGAISGAVTFLVAGGLSLFS